MPLFRKNKTPGSEVDTAIATMTAESAADEREGKGLENRRRYVDARRSIRDLGTEATPHLLAHLDRLEPAEAGSTEKYVAYDVVELLGETRDPNAVPRLARLLGGVWPTLPTALAKTDAGTAVLLESSVSADRYGRADAMGVWSSTFRPAEVRDALRRGLQDEDPYVREKALSAVLAMKTDDPQIVAALEQMGATDTDERLRERAVTALHRLRR